MAPNETTSNGIKFFTREEVAKHSDINDIWIIVHNKVYDVTKFMNQHPGGEEVIMETAGRDSTEPFEDIGHSTSAREMMEPYFIGELVEEEKTKSNDKKDKNWPNDASDDNSSSASWRSWLIPIALGVFATLAYRYFISVH